MKTKHYIYLMGILLCTSYLLHSQNIVVNNSTVNTYNNMWNNGADYCYDQIIFASSHVNINGTTTVHADHMIFSGGCAHVSNQASLLYDTKSGSNCGNANGYFGPGDCQLAPLPIEDITNLNVLKTQTYSVISFTTIGVTDDVDYYTVHFEKEMDYKVDF
ncbi:MAG: hypothetical protein MK212_20170, partial [Saprospiraceae bacterium]|nr:hypothetical protein [Saprospiraceae bacterium]